MLIFVMILGNMDNKAKKFVTFETPVSIWQALKVKAYSKGKTVKEVLNELIAEFLKEDNGGK